MKPLYTHQEQTKSFGTKHKRYFDTSDPGTGKTRSSLEVYNQLLGGKLLVLAPLSILQPGWGDDIEKYMPGFRYAIAHGTPKARKKAVMSNADIVITNIDAVKWLTEDLEIWGHIKNNFSTIVVDEFTHYKNQNSIRAKALMKLTRFVPNLIMLSGTPIPNTVLDIWYPALLVDNGKRLGAQFFKFRSQVCEPQQVGPDPKHIKWTDRLGAADIVADMLRDITIRHRLEDCIDMPENVKHTMELEPPKWLLDAYNLLEKTSRLETESGSVNAIHAGARVKKMLQLLSGAVYNEYGEVLKVHEERYQLVIDLIKERSQVVVAYNWRHELDALLRLADAEGIKYGWINGDVDINKRKDYINAFQAGELQVIFAHPQSASHGITLTKGVATIWCSPTYNAEHEKQFNHRIYRAGQTQRTETIRIAYKGTKEIEVYERLDSKLARMSDLLDLFDLFTQEVT